MENVEKKSILSRVERQHMNAYIAGENQGVNVEERTKAEEININNSDLSEDTDNKDEPRNESRVALKKLWQILWIWMIHRRGGK